MRLKQAKAEAEAEIAAYKAQREAQFQVFSKERMGDCAGTRRSSQSRRRPSSRRSRRTSRRTRTRSSRCCSSRSGPSRRPR